MQRIAIFCLLFLSMGIRVGAQFGNCKPLFDKLAEGGSQPQNDPKKVSDLISELRFCATNSGNDSVMANFYNVMIVHSFKNFELDSVEKYIKLCEQLVINKPGIGNPTDVSFYYALLYHKRKQHVQAIRKFDEVIEKSELTGDKITQAKALQNLATIYYELYQMDAAVSYIKQAKEIIRSQKDYITLGKVSMQEAELYNTMYDYENGEAAYRDAAVAFGQAGLADYVAAARIQLAYLSVKQGKNIDGALVDTLLAYLPTIQNGSAGKTTKTGAYVGLAAILVNEHRSLDKAEELLKTAQPVCEKLKLRINLCRIYYSYVQLYRYKNRHSDAYAYYDKYIRLNDEIHTDGARSGLNGLKVLHEVDMLQKRVNELNHEKEISSLMRKIYQVIIVSFTVMVIIVFFLFRQKLNLSRVRIQKQELVLENERLNNEKLEVELKSKDLVLENERLTYEKLVLENQAQNRALATNTLHILKKNEIIEKLNEEINPIIDSKGLPKELRDKLVTIRGTIRDNEFFSMNWANFRQHFEEVHPSFFDNLINSFPNLSQNDLKHCAYIKMNLNRKDIAMLLNVNVDAVKMARNRIKKKMELETDENLVDLVLSV